MKRLNSTRTLARQLMDLRIKYSNFKSSIKRNKLTIVGVLSPTARSQNYSFTLEYTTNKKPIVKITNPKLKRNSKGERIPHMYGQKYLCLYQPKYREFRSSDFLTDSIIPWISLWLFFYEKWHITGKWLGEGEHPQPKKSRKFRRN